MITMKVDCWKSEMLQLRNELRAAEVKAGLAREEHKKWSGVRDWLRRKLAFKRFGVKEGVIILWKGESYKVTRVDPRVDEDLLPFIHARRVLNKGAVSRQETYIMCGYEVVQPDNCEAFEAFEDLDAEHDGDK